MALPCPKRFYTLEDVRKHDSLPDLWMIIYNKVYNVSALAHTHPGGAASLIECGGIDATELFEDVAHSDDALRMLNPHCIGDVTPLQTRAYPNLRRQPELIQYSLPGQHRLDVAHAFGRKVSKSRTLNSDAVFLSLLGLLALLVIASLIYIQKIKWTGDLGLAIS